MSKIYFIGAGMSTENLTQDALKALEITDNLYYIDTGHNSNRALDIVSNHVNEATKLKKYYLSMKDEKSTKENVYKSIAKDMENDINLGKICSFVTIGDPMIYSSTSYIMNYLENTDDVECISGITSFNYLSNICKIPLCSGNDNLCIVDGQKDLDKLDKILDLFDNIVIMKVYKNRDKVMKMIKEKALEKSFIAGVDLGLGQESIITDIDQLLSSEYKYFTTIFINKGLDHE